MFSVDSNDLDINPLFAFDAATILFLLTVFLVSFTKQEKKP